MRRYILICLVLAAPIGLCDTLLMTKAPEATVITPTRGLDMAAVEAQWGSPVETHPSVGDPPITRWVYEDFIVYFEYDKVIHSVIITD